MCTIGSVTAYPSGTSDNGSLRGLGRLTLLRRPRGLSGACVAVCYRCRVGASGGGRSSGRSGSPVRSSPWRRWRCMTWCSVVVLCCGTFRSSVTAGIWWRRSARSCASTWWPATTRSARSPGISGAGSMPRRSWRTTTSGSAPTTIWSTPAPIRSSSTPPSAGSPRRRRRRPGRRPGFRAPKCWAGPGAGGARSGPTRW